MPDDAELLWIDSAPALRELISRLQEQPRLAVDTESNGMHAYHERVCLIQITFGSTDVIIDPLEVDCEPLGAVLEDPHVEVIMHGADFDIASLKRNYGYGVGGLFDTMLAARALGWPQYGLAAILEEHCGVTVDKRFQRYDWGRRPLDSRAVEYARRDTQHLLQVHALQLDELQQRDRLELFRHACQRQEQVEPTQRRFDPDAVWRIRGVADLDDQGRAVARALFVLRDAVGREIDRPVFKVLDDRALLHLSRVRPADVGMLRRQRGVGRLWSGRRARQLVSAIEAAVASDPPQPPAREPSRTPRIVRERFEALRRWRKAYADEHGVEPDIVLPKQALRSVAEAGPSSHEELEAVEDLDAWERERYGAVLVEVVAAVGR